jgi:hypothetical protein
VVGFRKRAGRIVSTTSSILTASANPTGLARGNYNGTVSVSANGASNSPQSISVGLTVVAAAASSVVVE